MDRTNKFSVEKTAPKLTETQREHLAWVSSMNDAASKRSPDADGIVGVMRGSFYGNQRTHDALVRKGLMVVRGKFTYVTTAGRAALRGDE